MKTFLAAIIGLPLILPMTILGFVYEVSSAFFLYGRSKAVQGLDRLAGVKEAA